MWPLFTTITSTSNHHSAATPLLLSYLIPTHPFIIITLSLSEWSSAFLVSYAVSIDGSPLSIPTCLRMRNASTLHCFSEAITSYTSDSLSTPWKHQVQFQYPLLRRFSQSDEEVPGPSQDGATSTTQPMPTSSPPQRPLRQDSLQNSVISISNRQHSRL